ncbi:hypothetical protein OBV_24980 [Oscillibacter valericigenes Sjm18-20]|nr:hypothetical protein OBV_24980 [Oscillibacter valericigenes Sjm18-20]
MLAIIATFVFPASAETVMDAAPLPVNVPAITPETIFVTVVRRTMIHFPIRRAPLPGYGGQVP